MYCDGICGWCVLYGVGDVFLYDLIYCVSDCWCDFGLFGYGEGYWEVGVLGGFDCVCG